MKEIVSITSLASISSLGSTRKEVLDNYRNSNHQISVADCGGDCLVSKMKPSGKEVIDQIKTENPKFKDLDETVLLAIAVSRRAAQEANWRINEDFGVNIGSSRGATQLFERYHQSFLEKGISETLSSPTTTLGNIASWVAHDLRTKGPEVSHSITCATALHAMLNGVAWIQSGLTDKFLVGGSEAALTPFTIAQMQALKVYAKLEKSLSEYPCRALDLEKSQNTMVIGEGAGVACLEKGRSDRTIALIEGIGYATELLNHNVSISTNANCFQDSMKMALANTPVNEIDVIVTHTPGTIKGDLAEINAIKKVFSDNLPAITSNKWKLGHTFGASGILSVEMAVLMMQEQEFFPVPFLEEQKIPKEINKVLVNAVGFGGNAVSILLSLN